MLFFFFFCFSRFTLAKNTIPIQTSRSMKVKGLDDDRTMYSRACTPGKILQVIRPILYVDSLSSVDVRLLIHKIQKPSRKKKNVLVLEES
jgi:hypothetical protein